MDSTGAARSEPISWRLALLLLAVVVVAGVLQASGTALALPLGTAFVPSGFALMAVVARLGDTRPPARPFALVLLWGAISALALGSLALVVLHVVEPGTVREPSHEVQFTPGGEARLSFMMTLLALSAAATLLGLFRGVREAVDDIIPIDPARFSHALALATSIAVTLLPLAPLFVLGRPPLPLPDGALPPSSPGIALPSFTERGLELGWFAWATLIAAGPGAARRWPALRDRLGLGRPSVRQLASAAALGVAVAAVRPHVASLLAQWIGRPALPLLPEAWIPSEPLSLAVVALIFLMAIGTELTYRGLLQPRLGLVLTNLVLAAPLAWIATWDGLFLLFGVGLAFGALRAFGNTVVSCTAHLVFLLTTAWMAGN